MCRLRALLFLSFISLVVRHRISLSVDPIVYHHVSTIVSEAHTHISLFDPCLFSWPWWCYFVSIAFLFLFLERNSVEIARGSLGGRECEECKVNAVCPVARTG
jgi:hypothetical protein